MSEISATKCRMQLTRVIEKGGITTINRVGVNLPLNYGGIQYTLPVNKQPS